MSEICGLAIDLAESVFQVRATDRSGLPVFNRVFSRAKL
jgi:hypothetical protein